MRLTLATIIAALACALCGPALSADQLPKPPDDRIRGFAPFLAKYFEFLLSPTRKDCKNPPVMGKIPLPTCIIEVDVWPVNSGGTDYCLTQFPREVTFDRLTRVVWKLKTNKLTSTTTGKSYDIEFHANQGIIPFRDMATQILGGGHGDSDTANKWWYHRINLHLAPDPAIVYVPLILQVGSDPNDVGVCAVGDPRMVNE